MNIPRFGGLYIKECKEEMQGIGNSTTTVKIAVTNDAEGNHLDKYKDIAGKDSYSYRGVSGEQVFIYESHEDGYGGSYTNYSAGENPIGPSRKALVLELIDETKGLYPQIKEWMKKKADYYLK